MKQFVIAKSAKEGTPFEIDGDVFVARPAADLPGGILLDLAATMTGDTSEQTLAMFSFLRLALEPESVALLEKRLRDPERPIPIPMVGEVATWLMEEVYSGRPTEPPAPSGNGRSSTGESSTDGVPPKGSTRSKSPSTDSAT